MFELDIDNSSNANGTPLIPPNLFSKALLVELYVLYRLCFFASGLANNDIPNLKQVDFPVLELPDKWIMILSSPKSSPIYPRITADNEEIIMNSSSHFPYTSSTNIFS